MKMFRTKSLDFHDCHHDIAAHLKRGEGLECMVGDGPECIDGREWIVWFDDGEYIANDRSRWKYAMPIPRKNFRVMPPEKAIPILIAEGYQFDSHGNLRKPGGPDIAAGFLKYMGTRYDGACRLISCPDCIIEECD